MGVCGGVMGSVSLVYAVSDVKCVQSVSLVYAVSVCSQCISE